MNTFPSPGDAQLRHKRSWRDVEAEGHEESWVSIKKRQSQVYLESLDTLLASQDGTPMEADGPPRSQNKVVAEVTTSSMDETEETAMSVDAEFQRMKGHYDLDLEEDAKPRSQSAIQLKKAWTGIQVTDSRMVEALISTAKALSDDPDPERRSLDAVREDSTARQHLTSFYEAMIDMGARAQHIEALMQVLAYMAGSEACLREAVQETTQRLHHVLQCVQVNIPTSGDSQVSPPPSMARRSENNSCQASSDFYCKLSEFEGLWTRYNQMDAKMEMIRNYARAKVEQGKAVWADQCAWLKGCRQTAKQQKRLIEEARHRKRSFDVRVDEALCEKIGVGAVSTLTMVTTLLDHLCASDPALLEGRKETYKTLETACQDLGRLEGMKELAKTLVVLTDVLVRVTNSHLQETVAQIEKERVAYKEELELDLRRRAEVAAAAFKMVVASHKDRKAIARSNAKKRSSELESLRSRIFETMTERQTQDASNLQQCITEWEEVQRNCDRAILSCTKQRDAFLIKLKESGGPPGLTASLVAPFERKEGVPSKPEMAVAHGQLRGGSEYKSGDACHDTKETVPSDDKVEAEDKSCVVM